MSVSRLCKCIPSLSYRNPSYLGNPRISSYISSFFFSSDPQKQPKRNVPTAPKVTSTVACIGNPVKSDSVLTFFKESVFKTTRLEKFVKKVPKVQLQNPERTPNPKNVDFLRSCGISSSRISQLFYGFPRVFSCSTEKLKDLVKRADEMGVSRESEMFVYAIDTLASMTLERWEAKLDLLRSLGFSEEVITEVFRRVPHIFAVSEKKIKIIVELISGSGMHNISFIVNQPGILTYNTELRILPRIKVIEILDGMDLQLCKPNTSQYAMSDETTGDECLLSMLTGTAHLATILAFSEDPLKVLINDLIDA